MDKGTIKDIAFFSNSLQEEINLLVYIPANYSPLYQYHLCIASDGRDYFQLGGIARLADQLIDDYDIEQTIFVGVPYRDAKDRTRKYIPTGDLFNAYMRFLAHELVPYLDAEFSTNQLAASRVLMGDSMAATASLMGVIHYPNIFGKAIMHSPYVDEHVLAKLEGFNQGDSIFLYHVIGLKEDKVTTTDKQIKDFLTPNRTLHDMIVSKKIPTFYEEFDGNHTWTYWKPDLNRALIKIFG
jgi:enterochelin esterase-like enzyme